MLVENYSLTDTHCHLAEAVLHDDLAVLLARAEKAGVHRFFVPSVTASDWNRVMALKMHSQIGAVALGIHPWFADAETLDSNCTILDKTLHQYYDVWVGEIGLDFLRAQDSVARDVQIKTFTTQLALAHHFARPIILHNVKATATILDIVRQIGFNCGGTAHAFSGSIEEAKLFIRLGFKIGIGMLLLNPNAKKVRRAAVELPLDALVLETDSPFMLRHAINEPSNILHVAEVLAQLRGISLSELAKHTERNALSLCVR